MSVYIKTDTILDRILARKVEELALIDSARVTDDLQIAPTPRDFAGALRRDTVALIAEVKQASPSKGVLIENFDPAALGTTYAANGAAAISVLTDRDFFKGDLEHLRAVRARVDVPVLRKDFVIDARQVREARSAGADAVLLIAAALEDSVIADLLAEIRAFGMSALVEVHDEAEMYRALKIGAKLIGVNNRDLRTFKEDTSTTVRLAALVPEDVTLVAESAIRSAADVRRMGEAGAHAVLIGEGLVKADKLAETVREMSSQPRTR